MDALSSDSLQALRAKQVQADPVNVQNWTRAAHNAGVPERWVFGKCIVKRLRDEEGLVWSFAAAERTGHGWVALQLPYDAVEHVPSRPCRCDECRP